VADQRVAQLLGLHRIRQPHTADDFGGKARHTDKGKVFALGKRIADAKRAVVGDAHHVAGVSFFGERAILRKKELRGRQCQRLCRSRQLRFHSAPQFARAKTGKGDAVAMIGIHVGLDLENEGRHGIFVRVHGARIGGLRTRRGRE